MKRILIIAAALLAVAAILWAVYSVIQKSTKPKRPAVATSNLSQESKNVTSPTFQGELPGAESGLLPGNGSQRTEKRFPVPPEEDEGAFPPPLHFSGPAADAANLDGPIEDVDRVEEDVVVTFTFIEDLAVHLVESYHPRRSEDGPGSTSVTFFSLNKRYGTKLTGLRHASPVPDAARDQILEYMVHPLVLRGLYNLYATPFLETMLWAAEGRERVLPGPDQEMEPRVMDKDEIRDMYLVYSSLLSRYAPLLKSVAGNARARELAGAYLETDERVQKANIAFQSALRLQEPEDPKAQKETMVAGDMLKQAIRARDEVKRALIEIVRTECGAPCREVETSEILAVSLWLQRRDMDKAVVASALTASELLSDLSSKMRRKAGEI